MENTKTRWSRLTEAVRWVAAVAGLMMVVSLHEVSHAVALLLQGVAVERAGFGVPSVATLHVRGVEVAVGPLPIVAYIQVTPEAVNGLPVLGQLGVHLAGVVFGLLFGLLALSAREGLRRGARVTADVLSGSVRAVGTFFLCTVTFGRFGRGGGGSGNVVGPVGLTCVVSEGLRTLSPLAVFGVVSVSLASVNLLPVLPLDGGKVVMMLVDAVLPPVASRCVAAVMVVVSLGVMVRVLVADVFSKRS